MSESGATPDPSPELPPDISLADIQDTDTIPDFKASRRPAGARRNGLFAAGDKRDDAPPRARKPTKKPLPAAASRPGYFVEPLTQAYVFLGMAIMPIDPVCANAIIQAAPKCAESLDNLAQKNEAVRRALFGLTQTSALGVVIAAHAPILITMALHHVPMMQRAMGSVGQEMAENIARTMEAEQKRGEQPE